MPLQPEGLGGGGVVDGLEGFVGVVEVGHPAGQEFYNTAKRMKAGTERTRGDGKDPIDELLADCIAESAKADVSGGYWMRDVENPSRCPAAGRRAAHYCIRRIPRDRTEFELCGWFEDCDDHVPVPR